MGRRSLKLPPGCKLMLGNGSDELISLLAMACDLPGATILAPVPGKSGICKQTLRSFHRRTES